MYAQKRTRVEECLRLVASLCGTCVLAMLALFALRGAWGMYGKLSMASASAASATSERVALEAQEARLSSDIARLSTEEGVEGELRKRYGFARPGEGVIQVINREPPTITAGASSRSAGVLKALFPW